MVDGALQDAIGDDSFGDPDAEPLNFRIPFAIPGIVRSRKDPKGLGRITIQVDGLFDEGTSWLTPMTANGGFPKRGTFNPPRRGSVAVAFFPLGIVGEGFYLAGGWSKKKDLPTGATIEGNTQRAVFEDEQWLISVDDRGGNGEVEIKHKEQDTYLKLFGDGRIVIHTTAGKLQSDATEAVVLGDALNSFLTDLVAKLNTHTHTGGTIGGNTGPPIAPFTNPSGILSSFWKVK